jgi:hypothetical protein
MSIKIDRACKLARMLPQAETEILSSIRPELIERLTGRELAMVMRCLDTHWHKARAFEARDILANGVVWDPAAERLIELYPARYYSPASAAGADKTRQQSMLPTSNEDDADYVGRARKAVRTLEFLAV